MMLLIVPIEEAATERLGILDELLSNVGDGGDQAAV
jgi:hypothetical protein